MIQFPNAKVNLGLNVVRKRPDGYHDISTVFYPIPLKDIVEIIDSRDRSSSLTVYGNPVACEPEKNLVMRAYRLLEAEFGLPPVEIALYKHIPDGAGLGGGSSDATFVLRMLNERYALHLDDAGLAARAARLGADCPFFVYNRPMAARGTGDEFSETNVNLQGMTMVVVKPDVSVSTAEAYARVVAHEPDEPVEQIVSLPVEAWRDHLVNDFEPGVFAIYPELPVLKQSMYDGGAVYASMSGSGSAIYALFGSDILADEFVARCHYTKVFKLTLE